MLRIWHWNMPTVNAALDEIERWLKRLESETKVSGSTMTFDKETGKITMTDSDGTVVATFTKD